MVKYLFKAIHYILREILSKLQVSVFLIKIISIDILPLSESRATLLDRRVNCRFPKVEELPLKAYLVQSMTGN